MSDASSRDIDGETSQRVRELQRRLDSLKSRDPELSLLPRLDDYTTHLPQARSYESAAAVGQLPPYGYPAMYPYNIPATYPTYPPAMYPMWGFQPSPLPEPRRKPSQLPARQQAAETAVHCLALVVDMMANQAARKPPVLPPIASTQPDEIDALLDAGMRATIRNLGGMSAGGPRVPPRHLDTVHSHNPSVNIPRRTEPPPMKGPAKAKVEGATRKPAVSFEPAVDRKRLDEARRRALRKIFRAAANAALFTILIVKNYERRKKKRKKDAAPVVAIVEKDAEKSEEGIAQIIASLCAGPLRTLGNNTATNFNLVEPKRFYNFDTTEKLNEDIQLISTILEQLCASVQRLTVETTPVHIRDFLHNMLKEAAVPPAGYLWKVEQANLIFDRRDAQATNKRIVNWTRDTRRMIFLNFTLTRELVKKLILDPVGSGYGAKEVDPANVPELMQNNFKMIASIFYCAVRQAILWEGYSDRPSKVDKLLFEESHSAWLRNKLPGDQVADMATQIRSWADRYIEDLNRLNPLDPR